MESAQPCAAIESLPDQIARAFEQLAQETPNVGVVVDDENTVLARLIHTGLIPNTRLLPSGDAEGELVASILISEPHSEVRELLALVVKAMDCDPLIDHEAEASEVDLLLIEPASPEALDLARRLREVRADLPIVCVSIYPSGPESGQLAPTAYLVKPFSVTELIGVMRSALAAVPAPIPTSP